MSSAIAPSRWSMGTLRVSLIGIHLMFVDSLHMNRWLCGDKPTFCRRWCFWTHTHTRSHPVLCHDCVDIFPLSPMQSEGHSLIYLFQRMSDTAFQVFEQGIPDRIYHLVSIHLWAVTTRHNLLCFAAVAAERCIIRGSVFAAFCASLALLCYKDSVSPSQVIRVA